MSAVPPLRSDEKHCPYCAETIKAAAIKCRYCQSDLTRGGSGTVAKQPPPPPSVEDGLPASVAEHVSKPSAWIASARSGLPAGPLLTAVLTFVAVALTVACIVVLVVGGDDGTAPDGTVVGDTARADALSQATDLTERTLSYSYKDFDKLRKSNATRMSSSFRKQYDQTLDRVAAKTDQFQVTLDAKVVASGIVSVTAHKAKVLLFVNQTTSAGTRPKEKPTTDLNRVLVTMVRSDGDWDIDTMDALAKN